MIVNLNLLRNFIDVNVNSRYLKGLLTSIGIEVAGISEYKGEKIFEVEITPNRPDWLSHYGIAREIYSKDRQLSFKEIKTEKKELKHSGNLEIKITDSNDCARYSGALVKNVEVKESSPEVKDIIMSLGLRPVNNMVDISNLILMLYGHPTHIFDFDKLEGHEIRIRKADADEKITLLDGMSVSLGKADVVIADKSSPIALAGVMGGKESGVTEKTRNIVIESAWFNPSRVRRTSKKLGLKTDSSFLFERGADIDITKTIVEVVLEMIRKDQGKELEISDVFDFYPGEKKKQFVLMGKEFPSVFTGINIDPSLYIGILKNLGFEIIEKNNSLKVTVPSFRVDIEGKEDLVEEIIRIYGYDKLRSVIPLTVNNSVFNTKKRDLIRLIRTFIEAKGFTEVINYSFHSEKDNLPFGKTEEFIEIKNPIGSEFSTMRNSLLPGLIKNTILNFNNDFKSIALYEFGTIFAKKNGSVMEKRVFSMTASGEYTYSNWREKDSVKYDFFLFKSSLFSLFKKIRLNATLKTTDKYGSFLEKGKNFEILLNGKSSGYMGKVKRELLEMYKLEEDLFASELDLNIIMDLVKNERFEMWNKFPSSSRDLSFLIDKNISFNTINDFISKIGIDHLENFDLIDIFESDKIPKRKKSMLISFRYRSKQGTLMGEEVNLLHKKVIKKMEENFGIIPR